MVTWNTYQLNFSIRDWHNQALDKRAKYNFHSLAAEWRPPFLSFYHEYDFKVWTVLHILIHTDFYLYSKEKPPQMTQVVKLNGTSSWCHCCLELSLEFFFPTLSGVLIVVGLETKNKNEILNHKQLKLILLTKNWILQKWTRKIIINHWQWMLQVMTLQMKTILLIHSWPKREMWRVITSL